MIPWSCTPRIRRKIDASRDVAPLVAPAGLQLTTEMLVKVDEIIRLQEHVAKFGVAHAGIAPLQAGLHRILGEHHIHGKMLAHVAKEFQEAETAHPIVVVHQLGRTRFTVEVEKSPQLLLQGGNIGAEDLDVQQVAFFALAAGVADHAGRPAHEGQWPMPRLLKSPQQHHRHEVPHVHAVRRGIKANINRPRPLVEPRL